MRTFAFFILALLLTLPTSAQEAPDSPTWPVVERCIGAPSTPPEYWSFEGTILMTSDLGIHAYQAGWDTPRIVGFFNRNSRGDTPVIGAQLSPDGNWYATPMGERFREISFNIYWFIDGMRVYDTSGENNPLEFELRNYHDIYVYYPTAWSYLPVEWQDNQSLIIGGVLLNPFNDAAQKVPFNLRTSGFMSPDLTRFYGWIEIDGDYLNGFVNLTYTRRLELETENIEAIAWQRNSSGFIAFEDGDERRGLSYYNRDGELIEFIFDLSEGGVDWWRGDSGRNDLQWSPNNKYFAFIRQSYPNPNRLYVIDQEQKIIIDTCLNPRFRFSWLKPVWSHDDKYLAYITNGAS